MVGACADWFAVVACSGGLLGCRYRTPALSRTTKIGSAPRSAVSSPTTSHRRGDAGKTGADRRARLARPLAQRAGERQAAGRLFALCCRGRGSPPRTRLANRSVSTRQALKTSRRRRWHRRCCRSFGRRPGAGAARARDRFSESCACRNKVLSHRQDLGAILALDPQMDRQDDRGKGAQRHVARSAKCAIPRIPGGWNCERRSRN